MSMIKKVLAAVCLLSAMTACSKDEEDKLMGKWQLKEVVTAEGDIQKVDTVWYNFQTSIFMYQIYDSSREDYKYRKCYGYNKVEEEKQLWIQLISDPHPVEEFLKYTDWSSAQRTFVIEKLTGKELVLSDNHTQYVFRKF